MSGMTRLSIVAVLAALLILAAFAGRTMSSDPEWRAEAGREDATITLLDHSGGTIGTWGT
jgi:hypothetical protein